MSWVIVLCLLVGTACDPPDQYVAEIHKFFVESNAKYFGGKLPEPLFLWDEELNSWAMAIGTKKRPLAIVLSPRLKEAGGEYMRIILLHEMAHMATWGKCDNHGKCFHRRLLRLAKAGAYKELW